MIKTSINQTLMDWLRIVLHNSQWTHLTLEAIMLSFNLHLKVVASFLESLLLTCGKFSNSSPLIFKHKWLFNVACARVCVCDKNQSCGPFNSILFRVQHFWKHSPPSHWHIYSFPEVFVPPWNSIIYIPTWAFRCLVLRS